MMRVLNVYVSKSYKIIVQNFCASVELLKRYDGFTYPTPTSKDGDQEFSIK